MRKLIITQENFELIAPFKIAHGTRYESEVIKVEIIENGTSGLGESVPYARYNESCDSVIKQIEQMRDHIENGISIEKLQKAIPHGAARNALDCALWDLKSKQTSTPIWQLTNLPKPKKIQTAFTLVIDAPEKMALDAAKLAQDFPILKLKLAGDGKDDERIKQVRSAAPESTMVLDANESWDEEIYHKLIKTCQDANIAMIEQPFKASNDYVLKTLDRPIPICADESCHISDDLENLVEKYDMVNIKLDKTGGLTEGLKLAEKARKMNFQIMLGCMVGTSLSILPAFYLAQIADFIDLDCPLLLKQDRNLLKFEGGNISLLP